MILSKDITREQRRAVLHCESYEPEPLGEQCGLTRMVRLQLLRHPAGLHPHGRARGEELVEDARLGETQHPSR